MLAGAGTGRASPLGASMIWGPCGWINGQKVFNLWAYVLVRAELFGYWAIGSAWSSFAGARSGQAEWWMMWVYLKRGFSAQAGTRA